MARSAIITKQNLWTRSEDPANWNVSNLTAVSGLGTTPNGLSYGAIKEVANGFALFLPANQLQAGFWQTESVTMKAGSRRYVTAYTNNATTGRASFDLQTGTVATFPGAEQLTASITSLGSGWYRCTISNLVVGNGGYDTRWYLSDTLGGFSISGTVAGTNAIYATGAHKIYGAVERPESYVLTTSSMVGSANGLRNVRSGGVAPSNRVAPVMAQNLITWSGDVTHSPWNINNSTTSSVADPFGGNSATQIIADGTTGTHQYWTPIVVSSGLTYTFSAYYKAVSGQTNWIYLGVNNGAGSVAYNPVDGTFGSNSGVVSFASTPIGNGWYRASVTYVGTTGTSERLIILQAGNGSSGLGWSGTGQGIITYGQQRVISNWSMRYTPTTSAAVNDTVGVRQHT